MSNVLKELKSWKNSYLSRRNYCTLNKLLFYNIASKYLPINENALIVDVGAGKGRFADYLNLARKYKNLFLLDGNKTTVENLKNRFKNVILLRVPEKLPFQNASVNYLHCSHLIEHLYPKDLYQFLKEVDRVLYKGGIFVVSSPTLWSGFYSDLSHIRPYNPAVILNYLCHSNKNPSGNIISTNYTQLELIYRYRTLDLDEDWGSKFMPVDFVIHFTKWVFSKLGLKKYAKNGYILILKKK